MSRPVDVLGLVLVLAAVALGTWLGLQGPDVSPVLTQAPPLPLGGIGR